MTVNANFDAILSTTLANYRDTLEDNLSTNVAVWYFLKENGSVTRKGGVKAVEQILHGANSTAASYADYEPISLTPQEGISAAEYAWKQHAVTVAISGMEEAKNTGEYAIVDLLQSKIKQAEISAIEDFDAMFLGDGTGNSAKDFLGLDALIGDASSGVTTVGGINCTSGGNEFWRSYVKRSQGALKLEDLHHTFNKAVRGRSMPKFGITTQTLYEAYNALLQVNQRFTDPKTAEAGFQNLTFQGAPVVWGDNVATGDWFFVNPDYIKLAKLGDNWLKQTPFVTPEDVDARYAKILSKGQMVCSNRKLAGSKLEDATA